MKFSLATLAVILAACNTASASVGSGKHVDARGIGASKPLHGVTKCYEKCYKERSSCDKKPLGADLLKCQKLEDSCKSNCHPKKRRDLEEEEEEEEEEDDEEEEEEEDDEDY